MYKRQRTDATYADNVIVITNHLVAYPNAPWAIPEFEVDYVVMTMTLSA